MTEHELKELGLGCGDNSCYFVKPLGMATNGGCRCFEKVVEQRSIIKAAFVLLPMYLQTLKQLNELKNKETKE